MITHLSTHSAILSSVCHHFSLINFDRIDSWMLLCFSMNLEELLRVHAEDAKHYMTSKVGEVNRKGSIVKYLFDRICPSSRPQGANPVRSSSRLIPQQVKTTIHWLVPISSLCDRGCAQWDAWVSPRISELCKLTTVGHGTTAPLLLVRHRNSWARRLLSQDES